jgi:hypothetical protein
MLKNGAAIEETYHKMRKKEMCLASGHFDHLLEETLLQI